MTARGELSVVRQFGELRSEYEAARDSRWRRRRVGVSSMPRTADDHLTQSSYFRMIAEAQDMDRNDVFMGQMVNRAVDITCQDGFTLRPNTGDKALDEDIRDWWWEWCQSPDACDAAGEKTWMDIERQALRGMLVDGDHFAIVLEDGRVQCLEATRCQTPGNTSRNVVIGVLLDDLRRRVEFWFTSADLNGGMVQRVSDMRRIATRNADGIRQVCHVYNPRRESQTRGVTGFAPVMTTSSQFEDIQFAKLVQQQMVSCVAILRETEASAVPVTAPKRGIGGAASVELTPQGIAEARQRLAPGQEIIGRPGEKISGFSPNVPNAEYFPHVKMTLQLMSVNFGLPLIVALLDASETNFSGWRGAFDLAKYGWRANQRCLSRRMHTPVYTMRLLQRMADDRVFRAAGDRLGKLLFRHDWGFPAWPYIQPLQDAQADLLQLRSAMTSPRRLHASKDRDWEDVAKEIVEDHALAIRMAKREAAAINAEFPGDEPITWRDLMPLPTSEGASMTLSQTRAVVEDAPAVG